MNLETPTKIAALIAVVAYVVGVLTVGIYVQHNDIPAPDLTAFKAHYIYTGVEVLGLLGAAAAVISLCMLVAERASKTWAVAIGIGLAAVVWFLYAQFLEGGFTSPKPLRALWLVLVSGACALFIWATWRWAEAAASDKDFRLGRHNLEKFKLLFVGTAAVVALVGATFFTSMYARWIYGLISDQFGGGKPKQALILFTATGADEAKQLGIPLQPDSQVSLPVSILLDGESYYAVRAPGGRVVQIAKSSVDGLQVDSKPPDGVDVQTRNRGGITGDPQAGDQLILTYSEAMDPSSLIPGWSGKDPITAQLSVTPANGGDEVRFPQPGSRAKPALGTIEMSSGAYGSAFGPQPYEVTLDQRGPNVVITLNSNPPPRRPIPSPDTMTWTPSTKATDVAGNPYPGGDVDERSHGTSGAGDTDF